MKTQRTNRMDTVTEQLAGLVKGGYTESFKAIDGKIMALNSKKEYAPSDLKIVEVHRFEGMTNPSDSSELMAIEAQDGTKGTLLMAYGPDQSQDVDVIKKIQESL